MRWLRRVMLLVLLGAIINIAVAWGCATFLTATEYGFDADDLVRPRIGFLESKQRGMHTLFIPVCANASQQAELLDQVHDIIVTNQSDLLRTHEGVPTWSSIIPRLFADQ